MKVFLTLLVILFGITNANASDWSNGHLSSGTFVWANGGGDPYRGTLDTALRLAGIGDARVRSLINTAVERQPNGQSAYTIQDGDRLGVMISGDGWVARNPVARVSLWKAGRSHQAAVWYVLDPQTGVQYRVMRAAVCGNWLIEFFGAPERCRCEVGVDAC